MLKERCVKEELTHFILSTWRKAGTINREREGDRGAHSGERTRGCLGMYSVSGAFATQRSCGVEHVAGCTEGRGEVIMLVTVVQALSKGTMFHIYLK